MVGDLSPTLPPLVDATDGKYVRGIARGEAGALALRAKDDKFFFYPFSLKGP